MSHRTMAGRLVVEHNDDGTAVGVLLKHWEMAPLAILTVEEAEFLHQLLGEAIAGAKALRRQKIGEEI